ncbi:MAG TPA: dipicolinate synthase subunit DpsA [Lachnospiraceae bacterium]|nr:dipicolinate synthase subunit DpsA [Lachnospiraceae bacterium]
MNLNIAIFGGDKRNYYMAEVLEKRGYQIFRYGLCSYDDELKSCSGEMEDSLSSIMNQADVFIGPIPFSKDGHTIYSSGNKVIEIDDFCKYIKKGDLIFGGNISPLVQKISLERKSFCYDYLKVEDIALKNAVSTAEGAIAEAIIESDINLYQSNCLVLGYGKCGKALANRLYHFGAYVTVAARKEVQLIEVANNHLQPLLLDKLERKITQFDFIFNTIPAQVLEESLIQLVKKECLIIDIASMPGGTDFDACKARGIKAILSLGIPGRYAPKSSAEILVQSIEHLLHL